MARRRSNGSSFPSRIDDLAANGLLGTPHPQACWERSVETLTARKDDIAGLAVASDERIEAYLLYIKDGEICRSARSSRTAEPV